MPPTYTIWTKGITKKTLGGGIGSCLWSRWGKSSGGAKAENLLPMAMSLNTPLVARSKSPEHALMHG